MIGVGMALAPVVALIQIAPILGWGLVATIAVIVLVRA